jgi:hypothetical protein
VRHLRAKAGSRHVAGIRLLDSMHAGFKGVDTSGLFCLHASLSNSLREKSISSSSNPLACNQQGPSGLTALHVPLNLSVFACLASTAPSHFLVTPAAIPDGP